MNEPLTIAIRPRGETNPEPLAGASCECNDSPVLLAQPLLKSEAADATKHLDEPIGTANGEGSRLAVVLSNNERLGQVKAKVVAHPLPSVFDDQPPGALGRPAAWPCWAAPRRAYGAIAGWATCRHRSSTTLAKAVRICEAASVNDMPPTPVHMPGIATDLIGCAPPLVCCTKATSAARVAR